MTPHEEVRALLALSAAGALDPGEERSVREHVGECAPCAAELEALAGLSADLSALPAPVAPPGLANRTQALLALELAARAERRRAALPAVAAAAFALALAFLTWCLYEIATGGVANLLRPGAAWLAGWLAISALSICAAAPAAAMLAAQRRRLERSMI